MCTDAKRTCDHHARPATESVGHAEIERVDNDVQRFADGAADSLTFVPTCHLPALKKVSRCPPRLGDQKRTGIQPCPKASAGMNSTARITAVCRIQRGTRMCRGAGLMTWSIVEGQRMTSGGTGR